MRKWSRACNPSNTNYKPFVTEPTISLIQWTKAWQWKTKFYKFVQQDVTNENCWYVNCSDGVPIENSSVIKLYNNQMADCKWKTFEEFANCAFGYWKITVDKEANESNWKSSTCTCPIYFKQYICKHIIGICILLKVVKPPDNAKDCPLGQKRPPGRPRLAAAALCRQRQFTSLLEDLE